MARIRRNDGRLFRQPSLGPVPCARDRRGSEFSREKVRVLARLDETKLDLKHQGVKRTDGDFAVAWVKTYGKGRVFYSTFGHREEVYDRPDIQVMYREATKWAM